MKFVVCIECLDWVKLTYTDRTCRCGKSGGFYYSDGLHAAVWGPAFAVGVANREFGRAVRVVRINYDATRSERRGEWWVIPQDGGHVEAFKSRRAALAARRRRPVPEPASEPAPAGTSRPSARRRSR